MGLMTTTQMFTGVKNWVLEKIALIQALIPAQASSSNQLADKAFVNSSIATATATFRGTYNLVSDLSLTTEATRAQIAAALATKMAALSIVPDANDYAFVQVPTDDATPTEIAHIDRYKYDGSAWEYEYTLNNSGFTAEQWAAINSGVTSGDMTKLRALPTSAELTTLLNGKQDVIQDLATIRSGASAGTTAVQPAALNSALSNTVAESGVYDVTANNNNAKFASLSALLSSENLNTLIPSAKRKGGMSVKFVQSSDNKYIQYRYVGTSITDANFLNQGNWLEEITNRTISDNFFGIISRITNFTKSDYMLTDEGKFDTSSTYKHAVLSVKSGEIYYLVGDSMCKAAFATSNSFSSGGDIPLVPNTEVMSMPAELQYYKFVIPEGCTYLLFNAAYHLTTKCFQFYRTFKEGTAEYTDNIPTKDSTNLINSGAVEKAILRSTTHIGLNSSYSINNAITNYLYDIRNLEKGKYFVALHKTSGSVVETIWLYRTTTNQDPSSHIIDSSKYDLPTNSTQIEIEITEETNYLWFFNSSINTYDAEFYLIKSEYAYSRLIEGINKNKTDISSINGSISTINQSINTLNNSVSDLNNEVDVLDDKIDELYPTIPVDDPLPIYRTDTSKFINNLGNLETFNSYSVRVYDVTNLTKVKIVGKNSTSTVRAYGFYSSDNIGNSTLVGSVGPAVTTNYEYELDVPATAKYLACTKYDYQTLDVTKEKDVLDVTKTKEIKVENGNKVTICVPSANRKLIVTIGPTAEGIANGLIDFRYWGYSPLELGLGGTRTKLYNTDSDCFGPFQIFAKSNIDGDDLSNTTFTGGSHRYNNDNTGSTPTARLGNVDIRVDGVSCETFEGKFSEFAIQWEAYVQATNTKKADGTGREVLKQINTIKYVDGEFRCSTELIPLEDIRLHLWYGYQCVGINPNGTYKLTDHWKYVNAINRGLDSAGSGSKDTSAMIGYTDKFEQQMWVDTTIDMGKREMLADGQSGAFKSGDKGYFRIADNDATLTEGYHYYLYGKYMFKLKEIS